MRWLIALVISVKFIAAGSINWASNVSNAASLLRRNFDEYGLIRWGDERVSTISPFNSKTNPMHGSDLSGSYHQYSI